jgi:excisionase family DNA binding protein
MFGKERRVLTVAEVADKLRITEQHVIDLIEEGKIQGVNIGGAARCYWRIPVEGYIKFLNDRHSFNI